MTPQGETLTPDHIRRLRDARGLSRDAFGALFCVTGRTIESWEQLDPEGRPRRAPRGLALAKMLVEAQRGRVERHV